MLMKYITQILIIILLISIGLVIGIVIAAYVQPDLEQAQFCPSYYEVAERDCHYPVWVNIIVFSPAIITPLLLVWIYILKRKK